MGLNAKRWTNLVDYGQETGQNGHGNAPFYRGGGSWLETRRVLLGTVVTALVVVFSSVRRVEVEGSSMVPTLRPGDRLLAVRGKRARTGQLVVLRDPRAAHRLLVKRLVRMEGGRAVVSGDNEASSTDSAVFGPAQITARVVYRYHPPGRTGRLPRGWGYHHIHG